MRDRVKSFKQFLNESIELDKCFDVDYYESFWYENAEECGYSRDDWETDGKGIFQANIDRVKEFEFPLTIYRGVNLEDPNNYEQRENESWSLDEGHSMMFSDDDDMDFYILKGEVANLEDLNVRRFVELAFTNNAEEELRPIKVSNIEVLNNQK